MSFPNWNSFKMFERLPNGYEILSNCYKLAIPTFYSSTHDKHDFFLDYCSLLSKFLKVKVIQGVKRSTKSNLPILERWPLLPWCKTLVIVQISYIFLKTFQRSFEVFQRKKGLVEGFSPFFSF